MPKIVNRKTPPAFTLEPIPPSTHPRWLDNKSPTEAPESTHALVYQGNRKHRRAMAKRK